MKGGIVFPLNRFTRSVKMLYIKNSFRWAYAHDGTLLFRLIAKCAGHGTVEMKKYTPGKVWMVKKWEKLMRRCTNLK